MTGRTGRHVCQILVAVVFSAVGIAACGGSGPVRVGAKPFAEQEILANALNLYLQDRGFDTRPVIVCEDTYDCERALQSGRIDLMVEYSGTAFRLLGERVPADGTESFRKLRRIYDTLGIRWSTRLGFENHYVWLMPRDRAIARQVDSLSDLAEMEGPVQIASPPEYVRRSRDGLMATAQRYGIDVAPEPLVIKETMARYEAAIDGRADVVVGYSTDGALKTFGMRRLEDTLDFFPPYEATVALRKAAIEDHPGLEEAVGELENAIDEGAMRELNYAVDVEGQPAAAVARRFLEQRGLAEFESRARTTIPTIEIAIDPKSGLDVFESRAVNAVRKVFSERAAELVDTSTPKESVFHGRTRLAIMSADQFFERGADGEYVRTDRAVALVVLGDRMLHVVRREGESPGTEVLPGRVGTTRAGACDDFLRELGREADVQSGPKALLSKLRSGNIDTAVLLVEPGHPAVTDAMNSGELALVDVGGRAGSKWRFSLPYLRPVRIAAETYPNQEKLVDTMAAQVLLAGPPQNGRASKNAAGPAAGVDRTGHPVSLERVNALADALDIDQAPDPALPSLVHVTRSNGEYRDDGWFDRDALDTTLNFGILLFLGWLAYVVFLPPAEEPEPEGETDESSESDEPADAD